MKEKLCQALFDRIPVGVGSRGLVPTSRADLDQALNNGIDWSIREGYAWAEDADLCEEHGRMMRADAGAVSDRAKKRGLQQLGTLGAGNHYVEVQVIDKIYDHVAARRMGIDQEGQVVCFVHSGSRGLGHQVASDALVAMERATNVQKIQLNDKQLACARIQSDIGQKYLGAMGAAANFAWVNRQAMCHQLRQTFSRFFNSTADDLDMHTVYDVSHNIAKEEEHIVPGLGRRRLLVHRKGATRALPPGHQLLTPQYSQIGQPVLIGGTMGTSSYVLTGAAGPDECPSWASTCHGAGRARSRAQARRAETSAQVHQQLASRGIALRVASPSLVQEEAPMSYKNVDAVVETCQTVGLSNMAVKLRPIAVIKG